MPLGFNTISLGIMNQLRKLLRKKQGSNWI